MPENDFYTYGYFRKDGTPYYIGKGKGGRAYRDHGRRIPMPKDRSRIHILAENWSEADAITLEKHLIATYGRKDNGTGILRNMTNGGEGASGRVTSNETRAKLSAASSGKNHPMYGKSPSPETRAKLSAAMSGKTISSETRAKISGKNNHMYGKTASPETRAKQSAASSGENNHNYGKTPSPETRAKISAAMSGEKSHRYGKTISAEIRAKQSAARSGKRYLKKICPHCNREIAINNFSHHHGDNCKHNPTK